MNVMNSVFEYKAIGANLNDEMFLSAIDTLISGEQMPFYSVSPILSSVRLLLISAGKRELP